MRSGIFLATAGGFRSIVKASSIVQLLEGQFTQPYFMDTTGSLIVDGGVMRESQVSFENLKTYLSRGTSTNGSMG